MKKTFLALAMLLTVLLAFSACTVGKEGDDPIETTHTCTPGRTVVSYYDEPTCTSMGERYIITYCAICDGYMYDETVYEDPIPHTPGYVHKEYYQEPTCVDEGVYYEIVYCSFCGDILSEGEKREPTNDNHPLIAVKEEKRIEATCTKEGSYEVVTYCAYCDEEFERVTHTLSVIAHTAADPVEEISKAPTCYAEGEIAFVVYCSAEGCGAEISRNTQALSKLQHIPAEAVEENRIDQTHESDGSYEMVVYCSVAECHAELERTKYILDVLVHHPANAVQENIVAATCTKEGSYDEVVYCLDEDCGHKELSRRTVTVETIPHTALDAVKENEIAVSCTQNGYYEDVVYCAECSGELSRAQVIIEKLPHTSLDAVKENEVAVSCTQNGYYEDVVYCAECGGELSRTPVTVEKLPHILLDAVKENEIAVSCTQNGYYEDVVYCAECGGEISRTPVTVEQLPHTELEAVRENEIPASCEDDGSYDSVVYCLVCSNEVSRTKCVIDAAGHNYVDGICATCQLLRPSDGLRYTLSTDGTYYSVAIGTYTDAHVVIPTTYNKLPVAQIANYGFSSNANLVSVHIPDSVTCIGQYAFSNCDNLVSVHIPDSVTEIGQSAFFGCENLADVTIGNGVTSIASETFSGCKRLVNLTMGNGVTAIGGQAFYDCVSLFSVTLPKGLTSIGNSAFARCYRLVEVINHSALEIVAGSGDYYYVIEVHAGESKLDQLDGYFFYPYNGVNYFVGYAGDDTDLVLPEGYHGEDYEINQYAFYQTNITGVVISNGATKIGKYAFAYCADLTSVLISESVTLIGDYAFYDCDGLTSIVIPGSVMEIGVYAFAYCDNLANVLISDGVALIGRDAFYDCDAITSIMLPSSVMIVGEDAFGDCGHLAFNLLDNLYYLGNDSNPYHALIRRKFSEDAYTIHEDTVVIADGAFAYTSYITTISIPDSVKTIGAGAFLGCAEVIQDMTIGSGVTKIGVDAFKDCQVRNLHISDLAQWCAISFGNENSHPFAHYAVMHNLYLNGEQVTDLVIPEQVTEISSYAFYRSDYITSITIGKNVAKIGAGAFGLARSFNAIYYNAVAATITEGDIYPFEYSGYASGCSIYIGPDVAEIPAYMFAAAHCSSVEFAGNSVCQKISSKAFLNCGYLTSFTPSQSIVEIESDAFEGCNEDLFVSYDGARYLAATTNSHYALLDVYKKDINSCVIHKNTRLIANSAFAGCERIVEIIVPDKVISVGAYAFQNCTRLHSVVLSKNLVRIGENAFDACSLTSVVFNNINGWMAGENAIAPEMLESSASAVAAVGTYGELVWICSISPDADSDLDGLFDFEELEAGTDSNLYDTDGDGIGDGDEISVGLDSLDPDIESGSNSNVNVTNPEIIDTKESPDSVKFFIDTWLSPELLGSLVIKRTDLFDASSLGYIGDAYEISASDNIAATIGFEFDPSLLPDDADPTIYSYDPYYNELKPLVTTISGNRATTRVVTSFSTYVLLNRTVCEEELKWDDTWKLEDGVYSKVEIVFVIDDSGSMVDNDPNNVRLSVARDLISKIPEGCKIGIVRFTSSPYVHTSSLTTSKETAKKYLTTSYFKSNGGTEIYEAVNKATSLFSTPETGDGVMRIMIVLSDGQSNSDSYFETCQTSANKKSISIYTIGLGGSGVDIVTPLRPLSDATNGRFFYSGSADALLSIFTDLGTKIDFNVDSDGDGIPDYYEDNMVMIGSLNCKLDKYKADTDGDGLLDGQEVVIVLQYNEDNTQVTIRGRIVSNPSVRDSDGDGYSDFYDKWPMDYRYQ